MATNFVLWPEFSRCCNSGVDLPIASFADLKDVQFCLPFAPSITITHSWTPPQPTLAGWLATRLSQKSGWVNLCMSSCAYSQSYKSFGISIHNGTSHQRWLILQRTLRERKRRTLQNSVTIIKRWFLEFGSPVASGLPDLWKGLRKEKHIEKKKYKFLWGNLFITIKIMKKYFKFEFVLNNLIVFPLPLSLSRCYI